MHQPDRPKASPPESASAKPDTTDRVEISLDGRARLADLADKGLKAYGTRPEDNQTRPQELSGGTDRISEIRQKIESGFYDRPEVRDQIAKNLTDDLGIG